MTDTPRTHYVYTAYDLNGRVLYVGCTKDLTKRMAAHRTQSDWWEHAVRFHVRGPYTRDGGFALERERLLTDRPLWGFHPKRRTLIAIRNRVIKAERQLLMNLGADFWDTIPAAEQAADALIPYPGNRAPVDVTDDSLRAAFAAENAHRLSIARRAA